MLARVVVHSCGRLPKVAGRGRRHERQDEPGRVRRSALSPARLRQLPLARRHGGDRPELQGDLRPARCNSKTHAPVEVEDNYIRESILEPEAKIVKGYQPVMPTYKGVLSDKDITALIEFIKSRK